jgi:hypothetical protein
MGNESNCDRLTIEHWENWLAPQVRQIELLGEISIRAEGCAELGKEIGLYLRAMGVGRALRAFQHDYPCAFAVFLVAQGIYGYQGGDYWSEVIEVTGLSKQHKSEMGRAFESVLEDLGLPMFYDIRRAGHRYVSPILAHGGIPNYCLPDFFRNMLQPSVRRVRYADMSAAELIDEWGLQSRARYFTDKPVMRFLVYGGPVAEDFVRRCREMAWEALESGIVPDAEEIGLPGRVVRAYRKWLAEQSVEQMRRESADQWRLRKPSVLVDPWGEGLVLDLPPQQVPATQADARVSWQVTAGEKDHRVPVRVRRIGFDLKTEAESIALSQPAGLYEVSLLVNGKTRRSWRFQGVDDERPLLAFDLERFQLLSWQHSLPARRGLGLLFPFQHDLHVEGDARLMEELPRMPWGWSSYRGQVWDLSRATKLRLSEDGEPGLIVALQRDISAQRPYLSGGRPFSPGRAHGRAPFYVGSPPRIHIPLPGRRSLDEELANWRLVVRNDWPAVPELVVKTTLADLRAKLEDVGEDTVALPLSLPALLGDAPLGNFIARLRGPLGRDAELQLRIVPYLTVHDHDTLYLPDSQGKSQPAILRVETLPEHGLECREEDGIHHLRVTERTPDKKVFGLQADPDTTRVELSLTHKLPCGDTVRVPFSLPVRRLRWALSGEQEGPVHREWTGQVIKCPVDVLLEMSSPFLLVRLPPAGGTEQCEPKTRLTLRLLDVDDILLQSTDAASSRGSQHLYRFDLTAFRDTIKGSDSPALRFELDLRNLPDREDVCGLPLLSLARTLLVEDVVLEPRPTEDRVIFDLRWREAKPLRNRRVRLWPLWRPWDPVLERGIPDQADGEFSFEALPDEVRSGKYRVEFLVVDPWVARRRAEKPPQDAPGTVDVELISPERQLAYLNDRMDRQDRTFDLSLERGFVCRDAHQLEKAHEDWQWCFDHLDEGTLAQILALVELVQDAGDQVTQLALKLKMFAPQRVKEFLHAYDREEIPRDCFRRYLANLPRSKLLAKDTCRLLLSVGHEATRMRAMEQLIRRKDASSIETLLHWVDAATLSDADAVALMACNPNFAVECLQAEIHNPTVTRLLDSLKRAVTMEEIVRVGDWVHSKLGWGRVTKIKNPRTGTQVAWIAAEGSPYLLDVVLHPDMSAELIVIDLASMSARFRGPGMVLTCSQCEQFSTQQMELLKKHTLERHPVKKKGVRKRIAYRRRDAREAIPLQTLEFASQKPKRELS